MSIVEKQIYKAKGETFSYYIDLVENNHVFFHYIGSVDSLPKSERIPIKIFEWMIETGEVSLIN